MAKVIDWGRVVESHHGTHMSSVDLWFTIFFWVIYSLLSYFEKGRGKYV